MPSFFTNVEGPGQEGIGPKPDPGLGRLALKEPLPIGCLVASEALPSVAGECSGGPCANLYFVGWRKPNILKLVLPSNGLGRASSGSVHILGTGVFGGADGWRVAVAGSVGAGVLIEEVSMKGGIAMGTGGKPA